MHHNTHLLMHHPDEYLQPPPGTKTLLTYDCDQCGARYANKDKLILHLRTEHADNICFEPLQSFECYHCNENFNHHDQLKQHYVHVHKFSANTETICVCTSCNIQFEAKDYYDWHILFTHWGERDMLKFITINEYNCAFCNCFKTDAITKYTTHILIHHMNETNATINILQNHYTFDYPSKNKCDVCEVFKPAMEDDGHLSAHFDGTFAPDCQTCDEKRNTLNQFCEDCVECHLSNEDKENQIPHICYVCRHCSFRNLSEHSIHCHLLNQHNYSVFSNTF